MKIINRFEDNEELNDVISYIASVEVRGVKVNIYLDDYGQCYFINYLKDGEINSTGLGTYDPFYLDNILSLFDEKGYMYSTLGKECWDELLETRKQRNLENIDYDDFEIYDILKLYEELNARL